MKGKRVAKGANFVSPNEKAKSEVIAQLVRIARKARLGYDDFLYVSQQTRRKLGLHRVLKQCRSLGAAPTDAGFLRIAPILILATAILRGCKADVLTIQDTRRKGYPDENHAAEALRLGRILISCDRDYLDERRFPLIHCPGFIVCDFGRGTAREIRDTFKCLGAVFGTPQVYDKWTK